MKAIHSLEEYLDLLKKTKRKCGRLITNSYLELEEIDRYIKLGRLSYLEQERGIVFFCDEEKYYRLLYWLEIKSEISISGLDKPIAIRNIYKEGKKREELVFLEKQLEQQGFYKEYVAIEMTVPLEASEAIARQKKVFERILKKGKFYIQNMRREDLQKMHVMREYKEFHVYNFPYKTQEEYDAEMINNQYVAVYSEQDEMCACMYTKSLWGFVTGDGICVEEKYKQTYGLGAALMCYVLDDAINTQKKGYVSWCEVENTNSMNFHKSIGFLNTGKISEEWILE